MNSAGRSCALSATLLQVGRDTQTLGEPVNTLAPSSPGLICTAETPPLCWFHTRQTALSLLWPSGIAGSSATLAPCQLLPPFRRVRTFTTDKTNKRQNRYLLLFLPSPPALHSLILLLLHHHTAFHLTKPAQFKDQLDQIHTHKKVPNVPVIETSSEHNNY